MRCFFVQSFDAHTPPPHPSVFVENCTEHTIVRRVQTRKKHGLCDADGILYKYRAHQCTEGTEPEEV